MNSAAKSKSRGCPVPHKVCRYENAQRHGSKNSTSTSSNDANEMAWQTQICYDSKHAEISQILQVWQGHDFPWRKFYLPLLGDCLVVLATSFLIYHLKSLQLCSAEISAWKDLQKGGKFSGITNRPPAKTPAAWFTPHAGYTGDVSMQWMSMQRLKRASVREEEKERSLGSLCLQNKADRNLFPVRTLEAMSQEAVSGA